MTQTQGAVRQVGVIGLGTMGSGIAEVIARSGIDVVAIEMSAEALARAQERMTGSTARAVKRGKMTEAEQAALLDRLSFSTDLNDLAGVDLVVEAVPERLMWGSDWPHVFIKSAMPNDGDLLDVFSKCFPDAAMRKRILVDNPAKVYDFQA